MNDEYTYSEKPDTNTIRKVLNRVTEVVLGVLVPPQTWNVSLHTKGSPQRTLVYQSIENNAYHSRSSKDIWEEKVVCGWTLNQKITGEC